MIKKVDQTSVADIFSINSDRVYRIPKYQREYTWRTRDWDALFKDVTENDNGYFLGSYICVNSGSLNGTTLELIDGQQRFTSLTLLLTALYEKLSALEDQMESEDKTDLATVVANTEQLLRIIQSIPSKSIMHIKNIRREISNRTSAYSTIDHFAIWEQFNYIDFYRMGFRTVKNEPERLIMTPTKWINRMNVIGITLKAGRYGGTYQDFFKDSANSGYPCLNEVAV